MFQYILTDREVQMKTRIWMAANEDYLRELKGERGRSNDLMQDYRYHSLAPCHQNSILCCPVIAWFIITGICNYLFR